MVALPPSIAPVKCSVLPLVVNNPAFKPIVGRIANLLTTSGLSNKVDDVGQTIGKRYARTDEIGVPFGVTIDYKTLEDDTVTVRDRDSMDQIRVPVRLFPFFFFSSFVINFDIFHIRSTKFLC